MERSESESIFTFMREGKCDTQSVLDKIRNSNFSKISFIRLLPSLVPSSTYPLFCENCHSKDKEIFSTQSLKLVFIFAALIKKRLDFNSLTTINGSLSELSTEEPFKRLQKNCMYISRV